MPLYNTEEMETSREKKKKKLHLPDYVVYVYIVPIISAVLCMYVGLLTGSEIVAGVLCIIVMIIAYIISEKVKLKNAFNKFITVFLIFVFASMFTYIMLF